MKTIDFQIHINGWWFMIWLHVWSKLRCRPTIIGFCNCFLPKFWMETLSGSSALAWGRRLSRALALTEYSRNPRGTRSRRGTSAVRSRTWVQEEYVSLQDIFPKQNLTDSPMHRSRGRSVHLFHESSEDVVLHGLINALLRRAEVVQHDLAHLVVRNTTPTIWYSAKIWTNVTHFGQGIHPSWIPPTLSRSQFRCWRWRRWLGAAPTTGGRGATPRLPCMRSLKAPARCSLPASRCTET